MQQNVPWIYIFVLNALLLRCDFYIYIYSDEYLKQIVVLILKKESNIDQMDHWHKI